MKKRVWVFGVIIVIIGIGIGYLYHDAISYKKAEAKQAKSKALGSYNIKKVKDINAFYGDRSYQVIDAVLQNGKESYILIPDDKEELKQVLPVESGYTKSEILKAFKSHVSYKTICSTKLGVVDNTPAWEIIYKDDENRFVFSYYNFYNGDSLSDPIAIR